MLTGLNLGGCIETSAEILSETLARNATLKAFSWRIETKKVADARDAGTKMLGCCAQEEVQGYHPHVPLEEELPWAPQTRVYE